jgi:YD repeat-containing protein
MMPVGRMFGPYWLSSLEIPQLIAATRCTTTPMGDCVPQSVTYTESDGTQYVYTWIGWTDDGHNYTYSVQGAAETGLMIYQFGHQWYLNRNNITKRYNNFGYIQTVTDAAGATTTYTYSGLNVIQMTNAVGQYVGFTWTGNRVTSVRDPSGNIWTYGYDGNGMLTTVTSPGSSPDIRTYYYEAPSIDTSLLTGIAFNGVRYSTYSYYSNRQVKESALSNGVVDDKFTYASGQTTWTNAAGLQSVYLFTNIQGSLKVTSVNNAAGTNCPASNSGYVYDSNGYPVAVFDQNNNTTIYVYDAYGKMQTQTLASGKSYALNQSYSWDANNNLIEITYSDASNNAYAKTDYAYYSSGLPYGRVSSVTLTDVATGATRQTQYNYTYYSNRTIASESVVTVLSTGNLTTTYNYDTLGNISSITNALGQSVSWANYNGLGQPGQYTDLNGVTTTYAYAGNGNLFSATTLLSTGNRVTTYAYNNDHMITDISYPFGQVDRYRYDSGERLNQ